MRCIVASEKPGFDEEQTSLIATQENLVANERFSRAFMTVLEGRFAAQIGGMLQTEASKIPFAALSGEERVARQNILEQERLSIAPVIFSKTEEHFRGNIIEEEARRTARIESAIAKSKAAIEGAGAAMEPRRPAPDKGRELLIKAIRAGDIAIVTKLLGKDGVDPNCKSELGFTALSVAVREIMDEHVEILHSRFFIVKALIEYGADPHRPNDNGNTPYGYVGNLTTQYHDSKEDLTDVEERGEVYVQCKEMFDRRLEIFNKAQLHRVEIEEGIERRAVQGEEYEIRRKLFPVSKSPARSGRSRVEEFVEPVAEAASEAAVSKHLQEPIAKKLATESSVKSPNYMQPTKSWTSWLNTARDRPLFEQTLRG